MQEIEDYAELTKLWEMGRIHCEVNTLQGSWKNFELARSNVCIAIYGHFSDLSGRDQKVELSTSLRKSLRIVEDVRDRLFFINAELLGLVAS